MSRAVLGGAELPFFAFLSPEKGQLSRAGGSQRIRGCSRSCWRESSAPAGSWQGKAGKALGSSAPALPVPGTGKGEISPGKPRDPGTEPGVELAFGLELSTGRIHPLAQQLRGFGLFCDNLSAELPKAFTALLTPHFDFISKFFLPC